MSTAVEAYAAKFDEFNRQREQFYGQQLRQEPAPRFAASTGRARLDPRRPLDPLGELICSYVQPNDVVLDVGGGNGRLGLPLALRCEEVVNIDLSESLGGQFLAAAAEAGIGNVRFHRGDWLEVADEEGDVVLMANVTYFVREIDRFIKRWQAVARRRVVIALSTLSSRDQDGALFRRVFGEELHPAPAARELLPVLWEMDFLPEVRVLPVAPARPGSWPATRTDAVEWALQQLPTDPPPNAADTIEAHFDELFSAEANGLRPRWRPTVRDLVVTWEVAPPA